MLLQQGKLIIQIYHQLKKIVKEAILKFEKQYLYATENYFVEQVIKQTKSAMLEDEDSQGDYMKFFGDTMTQSYAKIITESSNLGIAQMLYESMKRN